MRKFITPFNLVVLTIIGFGFYGAIKPGPMGYGFLLTLYSILSASFIFWLDWLIRKFSNRRNQFIIELAVIGIAYFSYEYSHRAKTFIVQDDHKYDFIVTVYNIENQQELPTSLFTWNYEINVPENGILLTSTSKFADLPSAIIRTEAGVTLNNKNGNSIGTGIFNCGTLQFDYAAWKIANNGIISYSTNDIRALEHRLCELVNGIKPAANRR